MLPNLGSLQLFLRAVDNGSLSKAAEQSHIALSAASRRIAQLEAMYGVPLLFRTSAGVAPTEAGAALAQQARRLFEQVSDMHAGIAGFTTGLRGHVRFAANTSALGQDLPEALAAFTQAYPEVKLEIREYRSRKIVQLLRAGVADVGVVMAGVPTDGIAARPYRGDDLVAITPTTLPNGSLLAGDAVDFDALLEHDLVSLDQTTALSRALEAAAAERGKSLRLRVQVQSFHAVYRMVAAGLGIGILPRLTGMQGVPAGLRSVRIAEPWARREMLLCTRQETLSAPASKLVEHLLEWPTD